MIALLDTNVLIRFLTSDKTQKFQGVYTLFESLERGDLRVELKLIVLFQVIFVLKSFYAVPIEKIATGMLDVLEYKGIDKISFIAMIVTLISSKLIARSLKPLFLTPKTRR